MGVRGMKSCSRGYEEMGDDELRRAAQKLIQSALFGAQDPVSKGAPRYVRRNRPMTAPVTRRQRKQQNRVNRHEIRAGRSFTSER